MAVVTPPADRGTRSALGTFAKALLSHDAGAIGAYELAEALEADCVGGVSIGTLHALLDAHNAVNPLPSELYNVLVHRLNLALEGPFAAEEPTIDLDAAPNISGTPPQEPSLTGALVAGHFQVLELIGEGGMSQVYKAIDGNRTALANTAFYVAMKFMKRTASAEMLQPLEEHLAKLKELTHHNIARPLEWGAFGDFYFIAFEFVAGSSLHECMRRGPIPRIEAVLIISKVADALEAAHQQLIVHGDLKPGNVLVTDTSDVKLIDFGWDGTSRRRVVVTPRYASPQLMQRQLPEPADDVFALACIAYELLTGHHAFSAGGMSAGHLELSRSDQLSDPQFAALNRALDPDRSRRTASARRFVQELWPPARPPRPRWLKWLPLAVVAGVVVGFLARQYMAGLRPPPAPQVPVPSVASPAGYAPGSTLRDCPTCAAMRVIPAGMFVRGAPTDDKTASDFEKPQQSITIGVPFAVATNPVTVGEFQEFANSVGVDMKGCEIFTGKWRFDAAASWQNPGFAQSLLHPVTCVSWRDATAYAAWLSQKSGHHYRLPSAAEWEYAARAGNTAAVPWSSPQEACRFANVADQSAVKRFPGFTVFPCDDNYASTAPVGSYAADAFGLHDMLGNVFVWTEDCWNTSYAGAPQDGSARSSPNCGERELRGGSWFSSPAFVRASYRNHFAADYRGSTVGIRLVRDVAP